MAVLAGLLTTGHQLRAARSLVGMDETVLADRAGLSVDAVRSLEGAGASPIADRSADVRAVQRSLEAAGVEFLNQGRPGVRLRLAKPEGFRKPAGPATDAVDAMDAAIKGDMAKRKG